MAADLVCIGEALAEFIQQPAQADGRLLYQQGFGGDALTAAVAAARFGTKSACIGAIGRDGAGEALAQWLAAEGVETSGLRRSDKAPTGAYITDPSADGPRMTDLRKGSAATTLASDDVAEAIIKSARIVFATGAAQGLSETAADAVFHGMALARQHGVAIAYATRYRASLWPARRAAAIIHAAIGEADVALPTLADARLLTGLAEPEAILDFYLGLGPGLVLLTMGAEGVWLATPEARVKIPPFATAAVDPTGAEDCFCGAAIARMLQGDTPEDAAHYAVAAAAISTTSYGATAPIPRTPEVWAAMAMRNR
jgi:2-dehydro-3-deoxygluconokinase